MNGMVTVGISDLNVVKSPEVLVTYALGSCAGICLYDPIVRVAGLSHIMLPSSSLSKDPAQAYKFADSAIPILIRKMEAKGAQLSRIKAKIAGGAQMFATMGNSDLGNIGRRNVAAVKETLARFRIPILAEDTGKDYGRTVYFYGESGQMRVKSATKGEWIW